MILNRSFLCLVSLSIAGQAAVTSLFFPATKSLPKGYSIDLEWKKACLERGLSDDFDLDGDGVKDVMFVNKHVAKPGKVKGWRNISWAKVVFKLSTTKVFVEIPAQLDYLDASSGAYATCGNGSGIKLAADTCIRAGRFKFRHGIPFGTGIQGNDAHSYIENKKYYYPICSWMDSFSIANKTTDWINEGATNGKLSADLQMLKFQWRRYYSFDVEPNGIRIYNVNEHINGCADSAKK